MIFDNVLDNFSFPFIDFFLFLSFFFILEAVVVSTNKQSLFSSLYSIAENAFVVVAIKINEIRTHEN